jgi:CubicO group peptidase (beta-lactamase class C family)
MSVSAQSQKGNLPMNDKLKDLIISTFNNDDYKKIYLIADSSFKASVTEDQFVNLLNSASSFGKITSGELISNDSNNISSYKIVLAKKSLSLTLRAVPATSYDVFGLSFYKLPIERTRVHFLSDNPLKTNLDSIVQQAAGAYMINKNVAGFSIGIFHHGETRTYNFGETKKGNGEIPTENTIYEIGSVTKTFTGILLADAVLQGKIKLNDDIRTYLDGNFPNLQYEGHPIKVVDLSNHTSGLPSQPKLSNSNEDPFSPSLHFNEKMLNDILHDIKPDTIPGTKRAYSNFAVGLLGIILEKIYGMNYEQLLKKYILEAYGMKQTKIFLSAQDRKNFAQGYDIEGKETPYWYNMLAEPAGGIRSTTHDMLLYMQEQLNSKDSAAWLSHQLTFGNMKEGTGLNWGIYTTKKGYLRWSHDGGTDGFTSLCLIYPELNSGIILLTNNGDHDDQSFFDTATLIYKSWVR